MRTALRLLFGILLGMAFVLLAFGPSTIVSQDGTPDDSEDFYDEIASGPAD